MDNDLVQIGKLYFSKTILDVLAPLIGAIIGVASTYFVTKKLEILKWEKERKEKYSDQVGKALIIALEWLDPVDSSLSEIALLISSFLNNSITFEEFQKFYPDLISRLGKLDPPKHLQVLLPDGVYSKSWYFINKSRELQFKINADHIFRTIREDNWVDKFNYYNNYIDEMRKELKEYEEYLIREYKKTFGM